MWIAESGKLQVGKMRNTGTEKQLRGTTGSVRVRIKVKVRVRNHSAS